VGLSRVNVSRFKEHTRALRRLLYIGYEFLFLAIFANLVSLARYFWKLYIFESEQISNSELSSSDTVDCGRYTETDLELILSNPDFFSFESPRTHCGFLTSVGMSNTSRHLLSELPTPEALEFDLPKKRWPWTPPQEFHWFSQLPTELRLKIWREAFPAAGAFILRGERFPAYDCENHHLPCFWLPENSEPPVTLCVNSESREETMRNYYIMPGFDMGRWSFPLSKLLRRCNIPLYFNPRKDVGFVTFDQFQSKCDVVKLYGRGLRRLAIYEMPVDWLPDFESDFGSNYESGSDGKEQIAEGVQRFRELDEIWLIGRDIPTHVGLAKSRLVKELQRESLVKKADTLSNSFQKEKEETSSCKVPSIVIFSNMYDAVQEIPGGDESTQNSFMAKKKLELYLDSIGLFQRGFSEQLRRRP
jgi:hypothetical protein